jgi:type II secretory pathway component PulK
MAALVFLEKMGKTSRIWCNLRRSIQTRFRASVMFFKGWNREQGLALVMVLSLVSVMISLISEVLFQAQITLKSSTGERDKARAEMSALTGAQFAKLLVGIEIQMESLVDENNKSVNAQMKAVVQGAYDTIKGGLGGKDLSSMLNGFPIGREGFDNIKDLAKVNLNALLDEKLINAIKVIPGYFVLNVQNESGKFNLNVLAAHDLKVAGFAALKRVFSGGMEIKFLESKGYSPERLAANLKDYIDPDQNDELGQGEESAQYTQAQFTHGPKNGALESLEEIRRIPGFHDDEIFDLFTPYFTVWPMDAKSKSLNVNKVPVEFLAGMMTAEGSEVNDSEFDKVEDKRAAGENFSKIQDISQFFSALTNDSVSKNILSSFMGTRSSVFKVQVRGVSNDLERVLEMVIASPDKPSTAAGAAAAAQQHPYQVIYQRFK